MRVEWNYVVASEYDSSGEPWRRSDHTAQGVVQAYVSDNGIICAVVLVDKTDGLPRTPYLGRVELDDISRIIEDPAG